jgi:hypothetical protein
LERPGPAREQAAIPSICLAAQHVAASPRTGQIRDASDRQPAVSPGSGTARCAGELNIPARAGRAVILGMPMKGKRNGCIVCVEELLIEVELGNSTERHSDAVCRSF